MKVELISYAIRKNAQESYSLKAPIEQNNYALTSLIFLLGYEA